MRVKLVLLFLVLFGGLGYCREFFFVHLNSIMFEKYYHHTPLPIPKIMLFFTSFTYETLYYSKYVFTLIFILFFFALSYLAIKKLGNEKKLLNFLVISYLILLLLAALIMAYGLIVNGRLQDDEYSISRWLLGITQSPIICFILIASQKLYKKSFQS
ncbi:MAG: hypothetical protein SFY56_02135 [Bacteroidota bacterium]|nr:hypothetical protein [Bacteroidota bacterium]